MARNDKKGEAGGRRICRRRMIGRSIRNIVDEVLVVDVGELLRFVMLDLGEDNGSEG